MSYKKVVGNKKAFIASLNDSSTVPQVYAQGVLRPNASDEIIPDSETDGNRIFSMRDTSPADVDQLRAENGSRRQVNEILKERCKPTSGRKVSRKALDRMAGRILKGYQSKYDRKTLVDNLETHGAAPYAPFDITGKNGYYKYTVETPRRISI